MSEHSFPVRVYYEDTDFSGNVYHAAYLKFFERGRTEWLREAGIHHSELAQQGIAFAVRAMDIQFDAAAHIDDLLVVKTAVASVKGARLMLTQHILRRETVLTRANVTVVAIKTSGGPARMPKGIVERFGGGSNAIPL
ncbi:tol-pal system-associated acyl-CoA thioesterase [Devosia naphthalenivorans]|uniref:tol-pal system-associated acyl-CoA thioesterase n=1 Tax=Devosia naphthalenivorans TaxID=2082392 RepID=UPI000D39FFE1|nr:tol-pal system-associated acyl-CoA thioesterase [Devosia naphthalenivorans]